MYLSFSALFLNIVCKYVQNIILRQLMIDVICYMTGDSVYLEEETHREEFVLNETGRIWMGTVGKFCVRPWNFAQVTDRC